MVVLQFGSLQLDLGCHLLAFLEQLLFFFIDGGVFTLLLLGLVLFAGVFVAGGEFFPDL